MICFLALIYLFNTNLSKNTNKDVKQIDSFKEIRVLKIFMKLLEEVPLFVWLQILNATQEWISISIF